VLGTPQRPTEVTVHTQSHTSFATILACAVLALCVAAPAGFASSAATAPAFPSAVPSQPGELTGRDSAVTAAQAQGRYYASFREQTPLSPASTPADDGGVDWSAIGIAVGGTCLLAGGMIAILMRTRRRTGRVRAVA
jgi:hypothetical protein